MKTMTMIPTLTQKIVDIAASPGVSGGLPALFAWMM
jgi:hypothetical protein